MFRPQYPLERTVSSVARRRLSSRARQDLPATAHAPLSSLLVPAIAARPLVPTLTSAYAPDATAVFAGIGSFLFGYDSGIIGSVISANYREFHNYFDQPKDNVTGAIVSVFAGGAFCEKTAQDALSRPCRSHSNAPFSRSQSAPSSPAHAPTRSAVNARSSSAP